MNIDQQKSQHLYNENAPFEGVFSSIIRSYGKSAVIISTSGNSNSDARNVLSEKFTGAWISSPDPNSWLKFDFKMNRIYIIGYTLRVYQPTRNVAAPHSWCIEGSNDNFKWTLIDEHRKDYSLKSNKPQHFTCQTQYIKFPTLETSLNSNVNEKVIDKFFNSANSFRYIRLRQTDTNVLGGNSLCLSTIELFGYISKL